MKNKKLDILIVGAGPAGAAAAWSLSKTNLNKLSIILLIHGNGNWPPFMRFVFGEV